MKSTTINYIYEMLEDKCDTLSRLCKERQWKIENGETYSDYNIFLEELVTVNEVFKDFNNHNWN